MGTMLAMLFAEHDSVVSLFDISHANIENARKLASAEPKFKDKIKTFTNDYTPFVTSLGPPSKHRLYILSLPHGKPVDDVLHHLRPHLHHGDIVIDGGNEWYEDTERRQQELHKAGVELIGCGVSGGYQSARHGPSMSPSGSSKALEHVLPQLEEWAAKDPKSGKPCVRPMGPGGSGHYVKMVHNGIEQGMLGVLNEVWEMMFKCLHMPLDEISNVFRKWADDGELVSTPTT